MRNHRAHAHAHARGSARFLLAGISAAVLLGACTTTGQDATFRIRAGLEAPLNADAGWAGETGEAVTVQADRPFRLRMEASPQAESTRYALQFQRNDGDWEPLEAHDFPHPLREFELDFTTSAPGTPPGWTAATGTIDTLAIIEDASTRLLRASGGAQGLSALYTAPWPLPEFTFATRFRLPAGGAGGFAMLFAYVDAQNHGLARFDPEQGISILRVTNGVENLLAQEAAPITRGAWHEAEVQLEDGKLEINFEDDTLEFEVPFANAAPGEVGIAVAPGQSVDISEAVIEGVPRTPRVSIVATPAYANGASTEDLLTGAASPFTPGAGISLAEQTPVWTGAGQHGQLQHGEFEWPLVIRRFGDGAVLNEAGDRFAFRMVDAAGAPVPGGAIARVTLTVPPGHLGGTFVETPGRIGPWQATNGDLYFIMEPAETDNKFMMMKSSDGGRSWQEMDGASRPETGDLESVDSRQVGDRIHIVHQVTRSVRYHLFRTSDHPTHPDSWELRDEVAARAEARAQTASMAMRSDGSIVTFFLGDRLHFVIRDPSGNWSAPVELDPEAQFINAGPQAIAARDDVIHLAYFSDDGSIWYRRLLPDGTLTGRQQLAENAGTSRAEYGAVLPLAYDAQSDTLSIVYRLADGSLWERKVQGTSAPTEPVAVTRIPVITDAVDSQQPAADLVADGERAHVLFVDENTRGIFSTREQAGQWQAPTQRVDGIRGSWVRGNIIEKPDGTRVYGYVYDAGSEGGAGLNRYDEFPVGGN